jgi:hypothetical protein
MLAVKTTCRDRWRQILNEADRIGTKHLLTLQEGVSENQYQEMAQAHVRLFVPEPLMIRYPKKVVVDYTIPLPLETNRTSTKEVLYTDRIGSGGWI